MDTNEPRYQIPGQFRYDGMIFSGNKTPEMLKYIREMQEYHHDDVIITGPLRAGTTWVNEVVFQILHEGHVETALNTPKEAKWVFMEIQLPGRPSGLERMRNMGHPCQIESHLPARYFERHLGKKNGPKIIVTLRDPKDLLVSLYHFYRMNVGLGNYTGTWEEFFNLYKNKELFYEDIMEYYAGWIQAANNYSNVLIIKYEHMHRNISAQITRISEFLGKDLSQKQISNIVKYTSFAHMSSDAYKRRNNPLLKESISKLFRKGQVGDWQELFTHEQATYVTKQCKATLEPLGLDFN